MYLEKFLLPIDRENRIIKTKMAENGGPYGYIDNPYPCGIFKSKELAEIVFSKVTILYGGNGSGKSTLLNLIAEKLSLNRIAPYNSSETFSLYVSECGFELGFDDEGFQYRIPNGSRIITSDDIFDYMLTIRTNNDDVAENKLLARESYSDLKYGQTVKMHGLEDYEELRLQVLSRQKSISRRKFIKKTAGQEIMLNSNGETAYNYFNSKLKNDTLYLLDEPENSLSPKFQIRLVNLLEEMAHYCGNQFIIATHSPFILAMNYAKIYDLDSNPARIKQWYELENTKTYFEFFYKNKHLFLK